ncbi:MAG: hypothetical protein LH628_07800 [Microcoleus sp. CAN_BIN18]|nr:hypothetical protein [Microcoleus sp. CAN_BIN18]
MFTTLVLDNIIRKKEEGRRKKEEGKQDLLHSFTNYLELICVASVFICLASAVSVLIKYLCKKSREEERRKKQSIAWGK